jgi:hypothetical protein
LDCGVGVEVLTTGTIAVAVVTWAAMAVTFSGVGVLVIVTGPRDASGVSVGDTAVAVHGAKGCSEGAPEYVIHGEIK